MRDGTLVDDEPPKGVTRLSQMSVLLYLTEGHEGGETIFYPSGDPMKNDSSISISPKRGSALCFWHGRHPLSVLHEGAPIAAGSASSSPKLVIRTDVLFATEAPMTNYGEWPSNSVAAAMLRAAAKIT